MSECAAMVTELREYGVDLQFEKENISTCDRKSDLIMHIFAAVAEEESNSISRHAILAHEQYAQEGRPLGTIAFGYHNAGDHRWEIDETQTPAVRKAFQMASQGKCYTAIREELDKMETGGDKWSQDRLRRMLTNLVYKGDYFSHASVCVVPGKKVKNKGFRDRFYIEEHHEPIVAPELFNKVQKIVERGILNSHRRLSDDDVEFIDSLNENVKDECEQTQIYRERQERFCGGIAPFGYIRSGGKLDKDPFTAYIVLQMFCKAKEGEHATSIASWLEKNGIQSPRGSYHWSDNTVRDILKNDVYADDLISKELYDAVQERFHCRAEANERTPGIYQGIVLCGICGRQMAYHGVGGKDRRKAAIYACKYHTGANPKELALDHMPRIDEDKLRAEVLKQSIRYYQLMKRKIRKDKIETDSYKNKEKRLKGRSDL